MVTDYHTHTPLCLHAEGSPQEFVDAALRVGLSEYGIADHAPMPEDGFDDWRMLKGQLPEYVDWIKKAKSLAPSSLVIKAGLECDWIPGIEPWIEKLNKVYDWDYLIGSVHYMGDKWDFDNPLWIPRWENMDIEEVWVDYWNIYTDMAQSHLFDIMGHPDLIKKFGYIPLGDLSRFYHKALVAIADSGASIEINTAGLHKPCHEMYPSLSFLKEARQLHIPLVINSDAHSPSELGRDFDKARILAREAGYDHLVAWTQRCKKFLPL